MIAINTLNPLILANAGTQILWNSVVQVEPIWAELSSIALYDLGPGIRQDEWDILL